MNARNTQPRRKSAVLPSNVTKKEADKGHNIRSKSELCFPIVRTFRPKSEPPMSDEKDVEDKE